MPDWHSFLRPPYIYLLLGVVSFSAGVVWTCTGKARSRFHGWVYRAQEPTEFRWLVAAYYVVGLLFIGAFLYFECAISKGTSP